VSLLAYGILAFLLGLSLLVGGHLLGETLRLAADRIRMSSSYATPQDADHLTNGVAIVAEPFLLLGGTVAGLGIAASIAAVLLLRRWAPARKAALAIVAAGAVVSLGGLSWYVLSGADAIAAWSRPALEIRERISGGGPQRESWQESLFVGGVLLAILHGAFAVYLLRALTSAAARHWVARR
jgi:hypothetical protein